MPRHWDPHSHAKLAAPRATASGLLRAWHLAGVHFVWGFVGLPEGCAQANYPFRMKDWAVEVGLGTVTLGRCKQA